MNKLTITIESSEQIAQIEKLRGDETADAFVRKIIGTGLQGITHAQNKNLCLSKTRPEFKELEPQAITEALQRNDRSNPIVLEVKRLVAGYAIELKRYAVANGNRLPKSLKADLASPIEKAALQITSVAIRATSQKATHNNG